MKKILLFSISVLLLGCGPDNPTAGQWVVFDEGKYPDGIIYISDELVNKGDDGYTTKMWFMEYGGILWFDDSDEILKMRGNLHVNDGNQLGKVGIDFNKTDVKDSIDFLFEFQGRTKNTPLVRLEKVISDIKNDSLFKKKFRFSDNDLNYYEIILNKDTLALDKLNLSKRRKKSYRGMMGFFNIKQ